MNPLQAAYDWIDRIKTPGWLKVMLQNIQDILWQTCLQIGASYIRQIEEEIIRVSPLQISGQEKFKKVYEFARDLGLGVKENILNTLINALVMRLKNNGKIE